MEAKDIQFFRDMLNSMLEEILQQGQATIDDMTETVEVYADPADRATAESDRAFTLRLRDRERKLIKKIEEALERIAEGEYGWCEETGDPIGIGRLLARPTATLSIDAQERRERTQKLYGE